MGSPAAAPKPAPRAATADAPPAGGGVRVVLSFDVEEHFRIEAASGLEVGPALRARYGARAGAATRWLLEQLGGHGAKATFFVLGQVARESPALVRLIARDGHELASHGWDHRRVHALTPASFRDDVRRSKDAIEQAAGAAVVGYRAPTFSVVRQTAWAVDELAELGFLYDSSVYPVRHDRYGVPGAPRGPFLAVGASRSILEIPPATLRVAGVTLPAGGGGYFRLLPLGLLHHAIRQARGTGLPPVAMLYFHPWEFDPGQPRLPLGRLGGFRTYVGIGRSRGRLAALLARHRPSFARAADVAAGLARLPLPRFHLAGPARGGGRGR